MKRIILFILLFGFISFISCNKDICPAYASNFDSNTLKSTVDLNLSKNIIYPKDTLILNINDTFRRDGTFYNFRIKFYNLDVVNKNISNCYNNFKLIKNNLKRKKYNFENFDNINRFTIYTILF